MEIALISDTHGKHNELTEYINNSDAEVIIHSGDFSHNLISMCTFIEWYASLNIKYKILIPGNHETHVEYDEDKFLQCCKLNNIIGLIDTSVTINNIKFYGTPWTVDFYQWAYMKDDSELSDIWDKIPEDTNVLIVHGPPYMKLDEVLNSRIQTNKNVGSKTLQNKINTLKNLLVCVFGHIHEARGIITENDIVYINASSVNEYYKIQKPIFIQIPN